MHPVINEISVHVKNIVLIVYIVCMVSRRERSRAALISEIEQAARDELAAVGAAALSLRSVARRVGLSPSGIYRYFDGRDALLTSLIVEAFERLADTVERADVPGKPLSQRWFAMGRAMREWAIENPHDWGLLYGTPVPGYAAPPTTIPAGTRVALRLAGVVAEARRDRGQPLPHSPVPAPLATWLGELRPPELTGQPDEVLAMALLAYSHMLGVISSEVFAHFGVNTNPAPDLFDFELRLSATLLGLEVP